MSQAMDVIEYIRDNGSITTKQATDIGIYRLSARVLELRKFGIPIEKEMIPFVNRKGKKGRVARYTIPGGVPECFIA